MKYLIMITLGLFLTGCISTPYANIHAGKTVNIGGINVGVGVGNILSP